MTVVDFPARLPIHVVERLPAYDRAAYAKGIQTVTIESELAVQAMQDRLKAIMELDVLQVFGRLNNALSIHFGFHTKLTVDEVRAETVAIRQALAEIGLPNMAIKQEER
jgi:hypothetical protein